MSMTNLLAQEEGRAFVEAAEHFYKLEPGQLMLSPKPIKTPVFQAAQLHGTYFKYKDKDEDEDEKETLDSVFQHLPDSSLGTNYNEARKLAIKATKKLLPSLAKVIVKRSNKLNKGHIYLKWHLATKVQSAQELVKQIDPGYGWKIEVLRYPIANPPSSHPTPEKIGEADLLNTLDWLVAPVHHCLGCYNTKCKFRLWIHRAYNMSKEGEFTAQHKLCLKYKGDNLFKQDWFMGIYMQLMINDCPEWVDGEPTCATNFASMELPIFARDIEGMEASAAGPDIQLAQSWESPSAINSKATWNKQSHGLEKILFQQSDAKTQESSDADTSWNSPPFDVNGSLPSPATATTCNTLGVEFE
eukprot:jgi/Psemu1/48829/gm1.48829_g